MIQTAIIAFLLIGAMFLFTECGDSEKKEVTKVEVDKEGIPKYVTAKSHDKSYSERDNEISAASYIKKEKDENSSLTHIANGTQYDLATKEGSHKTDTYSKSRDDEMALASYGTKGTLNTEVPKIKAVVIEEEVTAVEIVPVDNEVKEEQAPEKVLSIPKAEVSDIAKAVVATTVTAVVVPAIKAEEPAEITEKPAEVVEVTVAVPSASDIVVPKANTEVVSTGTVAPVDTTVDTSVHAITIPAIPSVPEVNVAVPAVKSMQEFASNSKVKKELNSERNAKDEEIAKNALLAKQLEEKSEHEKLLESKNSELGLKIDELLLIAKEATRKAEVEQADEKKELESLLSTKYALEANLTSEVENERRLKATNKELSAKISELLAIAEEGTSKAEAEQNASIAEMQALLTTKENLEGNVTTLKATNDELGAKISELLAIAEEGTAKAEAEQNASIAEMQGLLSTKESLETNLTTELENEKRLKETNTELSRKISELLAIAEEGTAKAQAAYEAEQQEIQGLLSTKESLEANLTAKEGDDKHLVEENIALQAKIAELLNIAKKATQEATAEQEAEKEKMQLLLSEEETLKATNTELAGKITDLLSIAEEGTQKAETAYATEKQGLLSTQENAKHLEEENAELNTKIAELLAIAKEATEKASAEQDAKNQEFQALLSSKESIEENLTTEVEHEQLLKEENTKLQEELATLLKEKEEAKAKEEAERLAAEKEAEEKAAAEKAEAEKLAAEQAAKAEEEAKAKEEADRLAVEKAAAEKTKEAAAVAAEKKLSDAFSLTNVKFKTGSMQLTNESKKRLKEAATVMKKYEGYSYKIQGHTDNRGNENFNIRLSGKRAEAVKSYLVSQGVDAAILSTEGFGSAQPIASNDTREGRIQNRRVVFEIVK